MAERFVFRGWWPGFPERRSQDLSNDSNVLTRHRFSCFHICSPRASYRHNEGEREREKERITVYYSWLLKISSISAMRCPARKLSGLAEKPSWDCANNLAWSSTVLIESPTTRKPLMCTFFFFVCAVLCWANKRQSFNGLTVLASIVPSQTMSPSFWALGCAFFFVHYQWYRVGTALTKEQ